MEDIEVYGHDVYLNVYDLSLSNDTFWCVGLGGIFHSGIEIGGSEYSYGYRQGIYMDEPKSLNSHISPLRESRKIGVFKGQLCEVRDVIDRLRPKFEAHLHHILYNIN